MFDDFAYVVDRRTDTKVKFSAAKSAATFPAASEPAASGLPFKLSWRNLAVRTVFILN